MSAHAPLPPKERSAAAPPLSTLFSPEQLASAIASGVAVPVPPAADRARWDALAREDREALVGAAAATEGDPWPAVTLSQRLDFARIGSRRVFEAPYFERRKRLAAAALAHAASPEQRWADAVLDGTGLLLEEMSWCLPAHERQQAGRPRLLPDPDDPVVDLFAAETAVLLAWVHYLHPGVLEQVPGLPQRVSGAVEDRVLRPYAQGARESWWFASMSNWNVWITANVLTTATLLRARPEVTEPLLRTGLESLEGYRQRVPADGGCTEGIMYWWRSAACLFEAVEVLGWSDPGGAARALADPLLAAMARYPLITHLGGPWWASVGDGVARVPDPGPGIDKDQHPPALWHRFARATGEEQAAALAASLDRSLPLNQSLGRLVVALFDHDWHAAPVAAAPEPRSTWLPHTQLFAAPSAQHDLRVVVKGGHNDEPHNHLDVGSMIVACHSEPVLIDAGTGQYSAASFSAGRYEAWFTQSSYHCLPEVNGTGQGIGSQFHARVLTAGAGQLELDLAPAYPEAAGIDSWRRRVLVGATCAVEEAWQLHRPGRAAVHFLLAEVPGRRAEATWILPGPDGQPRGVLRAAGLPAGARWEVQPIELEDPILRGVWGERIARLSLHLPECPARGGLRWEIGAL